MSVKLGINPIGWTNDCMAWLGDLIPSNTLAFRSARGRFQRRRTGAQIPQAAEETEERSSTSTISASSPAGIRPSSWSATPRPRSRAMQDHLGPHEGLRRQGHGLCRNHQRHRPQCRRRFLPAPQGQPVPRDWKVLGIRMTEVADYMLGQGVQMAVHHHYGHTHRKRGRMSTA